MRAIILAGGKGTRLKPYTITLPKPLVPVGQLPILEIIIRRLKKFKVNKITICVNHMAEMIMSYFGQGSKWNIDISYSRETKPLSTVSPVKLIDDLPDNFFVLNGDVLTDIDFNKLMDHHLKNESILTVATYKRTAKIDFGVIDTDENRWIAMAFREKPEFDFRVSMGIYAFNRNVLEFVPRNQPFGFDNLMLGLLAAGKPIHIFPHDGYWLDIGRPDDYEEANTVFDTLDL